MNLLLVDDDLYVLKTFAQRLDWKKEGIDQIYTAPSVRAAIRQLKTADIHICLCDIEMPVENGFQLVHWILDQKLAVKVILLTSYAEFHYAKEAVDLHCAGYLVKPVSNQELLETIHKVVAQDTPTVEENRIFEEASMVRSIQKYLLENLEKEHTRKSIGRYVAMNPDYFARMFKRETGMTPNSWLQKKRIEQAKLLLGHHNVPLTEVASRVGFDSLSYFSKVFKDTTGISPKVYKNKGKPS